MDDLIVFFIIGFVSGIFTGFFGVGGGFFLTPVLNILGLQIVYAIGTSFFSLAGKSLFGTWRHLRHGNGLFRLGIFLGVLSIGGVEVGKRFVIYLESQNLAGTSIRVAYIVLLILISGYMFRDFHFHRKHAVKNRSGSTFPFRQETLPFRLVSKIKLPPKVVISGSKLETISFWPLSGFGFLIGLLSGVLGVGGGFISLPILIYMIGVPTITAVGTSLIIVFFTSLYGALAYALIGHIDLVIGLAILAGSLLGVQLGVTAAKTADEKKIELLFAVLLLCVAVSVFFKEIDKTAAGSILAVSTACALCVIILWPGIRGRYSRT